MRMLPAGRVTAPALRGLSRFADTRGLPASREFLLDYDVIEAFCVAGLPGARPSTKGTYRSALYRLAEAAHGPAGQRATPFPGAKAPPPYSPAERAEVAAVAAAQRGPAKRASALAMVVFGIGAGLRPGELVALRGSDVFRHGRQVMVRVSGPSARVVPVTSRYAGRAWELACGAGSGFVFRPGPAAGPIKTSSLISPAAWPPTRPRRGCRCAGPGPPSSAVTWPRAPRSRCCSRSPGSPRPGRWPATPATSPGISSSTGALRARWRAETGP